jgi:hypothetical protein
MKSLIDGESGTVWYFDESAAIRRAVQLTTASGVNFPFSKQIIAINENEESSRMLTVLLLCAEGMGLWLMFSFLVGVWLRPKMPNPSLQRTAFGGR